MSQSEDERLVVLLEARISEFEKRMRRAEGTGTGSYNRLRRSSKGATAQMEADMARSTARINQALASTSSTVGTFAKSFAIGLGGGLITGIFAGITSNISATVKEIATLGDEAKRAGLSVKAFQEWKFVAEQNRIGIDALTDGFKELSLRADEFVVTGQGSASEAFQRLGYTAEDLKEKLKDPSALMLEIIGRLGRMDKAAQIRVSDELFGGTGGEQFVQLLEQGEGAVRGTIAAAHEAGAVLDEQMIRKAEDLDRRWNQLTTTTGNWFKGILLGTADAITRIGELQHSLDTLLGDEARGRALIGNAAYDAMLAAKSMTEEQVEIVSQLDGQTRWLISMAQTMAAEFSDIADELATEKPQLANDLRSAAIQMEALTYQLEAGMIDAVEFTDKLGDVIKDAKDSAKELKKIDAVGFGTVLMGLDGLANKLAEVAKKALAARAALPGAASVEPADFIGPPAPENVPSELAPKSGRAASPPIMPDVNSLGDWEDARKPKAGGGGKGGGTKTRDQFASAMDTVQQEIAMLTAETAAFLAAADAGEAYAGMADYAKTKAKLLMAAQQQGLTITPELTASIEAQAKAFATAGLEAEAAAERIRQIEEASERGADAMGGIFGAMLEGADAAKKAVASLLMEIAKAQFSKGMLGLVSAGGGGGFLSMIGGLLGGSFDGGGYTGNGSRTGGLDGKGGFLALMHPRETVTDHTKGQSAPGSGAQGIHVTVGIDQKTGNLTAFVDQRASSIAQKESAAMGAQINKGLPARVQQINANPRRRG